MNTNVGQWAKRHGVKVLSLMAASAITAALLSACTRVGGLDTSNVVSTPTTMAPPSAVTTPAETTSDTATNETTSGAPTGHHHTVATATADTNTNAVAAAAGEVNTDTTGSENAAATVGGAAADRNAAPVIAAPMSDAVDGLERGHTRTLVGWSNRGLVVTYAGWFCDPSVGLVEGKVDHKTAHVAVTGASDGNGVGCDKASAVSATFPNVPRTAHVLELDPGHGKHLETVKFDSGDLVRGGSFATEETAVGLNDKHAATH